ncbi:adenylate kinase isoenzyme 1 [Andrena cerasifolii]|uniref:adenylate kinase isoenzyme 1 n=1 Tax=Andrena cerasifolii TaxID=2819439 RepID=UPI004037EFC2
MGIFGRLAAAQTRYRIDLTPYGFKCAVFSAADDKRGSKIERIHKTIGSMGNCIKPAESLISSTPRGINVDASPIKESQLPIIFLHGGPGAGKRTLCNKVAEKYGFLDIISSDIIRHEILARTSRAILLARLVSQGRLVPSDILIELITVKMLNNLKEKKGFIVSGFPRKREQCRLFDREVRRPDLVLYLNVQDSVLNDRVMARMITTTGRMITDFDTIYNEIQKFHKSNRPIIKYYRKLLVVIDGEPDVMTVYEETCKVIDDLLAKLPTASSIVESENNVEQPVRQPGN